MFVLSPSVCVLKNSIRFSAFSDGKLATLEVYQCLTKDHRQRERFLFWSINKFYSSIIIQFYAACMGGTTKYMWHEGEKFHIWEAKRVIASRAISRRRCTIRNSFLERISRKNIMKIRDCILYMDVMSHTNEIVSPFTAFKSLTSHLGASDDPNKREQYSFDRRNKSRM